MTEYNEGDLIEASKGEDIVRGRLQRDTCAGDLYVHGWCIQPLQRDGFTITVIETAPPKVVLPTEPGFYVTAYNDPDVFELTKAGSWFYGSKKIPVDRVIHDGGNYLRRLEPVGETAKKVLDRVLDWYTDDKNRALVSFIAAIRLEFGATA